MHTIENRSKSYTQYYYQKYKFSERLFSIFPSWEKNH